MKELEAFEEYCEIFTFMPNCVVPDCEFKAHEPGGMCYAHAKGGHPKESLYEYWRRNFWGGAA